MADGTAHPSTPVYLPWTTFQTTTDELRAKGLPRTINRSVLSSKSGSTQAQYIAALRFLGMIDGEDRPTERFKAYIANPDQQPAMMAEIIREKYGEALALGLDSTPADLTEYFRERGASGATGRKAITFFLSAARFANIELSTHWPQTRPGVGGRRRSASGAGKSRKRGTRAKTPDETLGQNGTRPADPKNRYIDLLLSKAEQDDELDTDLLDRIERVIGVAEGQKRAPRSTRSKPQAPIPEETDGGDDG
jgi:hypothetical protein